MHIELATRDICGDATVALVVIDVIRAFTTAAFAFDAGARDIALTGEVDEALALRARFPGALAMGEVGGLMIPGFDFGNSPADLAALDPRGRPMIQAHTAGTQGT